MDENTRRTGPPEKAALHAPAGGKPGRRLTPAAERALAEAASRRAETEARVKAMPKERGGRSGPDPVRYGDWEVKGIASDFS